MIVHLHAVFRGKVQGVGFRWFVRDTARRAGIAGWVKNLPDGSVGLEAEGTKEALTAFLLSLRQNSSGAVIIETRTDFTPVSHTSFSEFLIIH